MPPDGERPLSRLEAASGQRFDGPQHLLGQLVYYRVSDKTKIHKFAGSCLPGVFAGWRLENGCRYRGVVLVLDYEKIRTRTAGFENAIAIPQEDLVFDDHLTMPLKNAHRESLAKFSLEDPTKIPSISIPFSDEPIECLQRPVLNTSHWTVSSNMVAQMAAEVVRCSHPGTARHVGIGSTD